MGRETDIEELISGLPSDPGVYIMKDSGGSAIYIGKAQSLKKRVSSYFSRNIDIKTRVLVKNIHGLEYIVTDSEIEALLLENSLIKKHKPKFNVRLKDDKKYPYIAVTLEDEYPRVIYTRKLKKNGNKYFGPYTDARAARNIISLLNTTFKLRTCKKSLPLGEGERPCINFQMKRCSGACTGVITREEYRYLVDNAVRFLEGNIGPVIEGLNRKMNQYSAEMKYEQATRIRDIIYDIHKISEEQKVFVPIGMDQDFIDVSIQFSEAVLVLFEFRKGVLIGRKISIFQNVEYSTPEDIIRRFLVEHYRDSKIPQRIVSLHMIEDSGIIEEYLTERSSRKTRLSIPRSSEDRGIMKLIRKNIDLIAADRNTDKKEVIEKGLSVLMEVLNLEKIPEVIECFDISNIQGAGAVASMVVFRSGVPDKKSYRRYRIRGYSSANDPGMMHEVVGRRLQYLVNESLPLPDLLVVDGGIPQLSRAVEASKNFDVRVKIISIAKKLEEIFYDISEKPVRLPPSSPALHIIQRIRDEAHRFAVSYHRKLREKVSKESLMDRIPGVGPKTRKSLILHFKTLNKIMDAEIDDLKMVPGIGDRSAEIIYNFLHGY